MGLLKTLTLNNGKVVDVDDGQIIVFVGPNNVGKSQALKDIYSLTERSTNKSTVVQAVDIDIPSKSFILNLLKETCVISDEGTSRETYAAFDFSAGRFEIDRVGYEQGLMRLRKLLVSYLGTTHRLSLANPPQLVNRSSTWTHPIHYAAFESAYRKILSGYFSKAFGKGLIPDVYHGNTVPLAIGDPPKLDGDFSDELERLDAVAKIVEQYPQVQNQGDGIRSFVGIVLNLMIGSFQLTLIDEPESFLHPPQAKLIGQIIGEMSRGKSQVVLSTHSKEVIQGLLEVCPERLKVIRITREGDVNDFSIMDNDMIEKVWRDPLLKYSNIIESIFHVCVVLCESDSDCKFYSILKAHIDACEGKTSLVHYIHCGGKQRMPVVIDALNAVGMHPTVVVDIDLLNDEMIARKILSSCGGNWDDVSADYRIVSSQITASKKPIERETLEKQLALSESPTLSSDEIRQIRAILNQPNPWALVKKYGERGIPSGDATLAFQRIKEEFARRCIFLVPVGELEGFIKAVGGHGPEWVNNVLDKYPDLDDEAYSEAKRFIDSWNLEH